MEIELALLSIRQSCSDTAAAHMSAVAHVPGIPVIRKSEIRVGKFWLQLSYSNLLELLLPSWIYKLSFIVESVEPVSPSNMPIYCLYVSWADFWNKNEMLFWISKRVVVALYKVYVIP